VSAGWVGARLALVLGAVFLTPATALPHPLGNFSINRYTALRLGADGAELRYIIDMAEIPAFQEIQDAGLTPEADHPTVRAYAADKAERLKEGLALSVNGRRVTLETVSRSVIFPPGAGGLPTLKIGVRYRARFQEALNLRIDYHDRNYAERAGWKEIIALGGPEVRIVESSVPDRDRSGELSDYPADLLSSPPQTVEAHAAAIWNRSVLSDAAIPFTHHGEAPLPATREPFKPARDRLKRRESSPAAAASSPIALAVPHVEEADANTMVLAPNRQATPRNPFTELVASRQLGLEIVLAALAIAVGFGALHALEPGHGKTVVAAYLVGSRGSAWDAVILGLIVTASHTIGVYLLGGVTLYAQRYIVPERLYPWVGVLSGLTIAGLGGVLFLRRYTGHAYEHAHRHDHGHHHHDHGDAQSTAFDHPHGHHHRHHVVASDDVSLKELFALGVTGGILPCPAALVVLLSALSLGRVVFGFVLIIAFSVGLAAVLIVIGLVMVYARQFATRFHGEGRLVTRWLPLTSSAVMAVLGVAIAVRALLAAGIMEVRLS
jgi:ABC-type nickel/cobalt efflux system permease component RcnA